MKTKILGLLLAFAVVFALVSCGGEEDPCAGGHSFTSYSSNNDATCTKDGTKTAKCDNCDKTDTQPDAGTMLSHTYVNGICTCGATEGTTEGPCASGHSFTNYVSNNDATCTKDGTKTAKCDRCDATDVQTDVGSKTEHTFDGNTCSVCGAEKTLGGVSDNYYWDTTSLVFSMTEASDSGQLPAGTRRFYAGDVGDSTADIDVNIKKRNRDAQRSTGVNVIYDYSISKYDWSYAIDVIYKNSTTYTPGSSPDMYCNFVYDLGCAALKGCFANLKSNSGEAGAPVVGMGNNYFQFNSPDYEYSSDNYFDSESGKGYFYQYMLSLSLSNDKIYCLGSNYCTDLVRAFHIIPVNIELMNTINKKRLPTIEGITFEGEEVLPENYDSNIEYFYALVWGGGWTYDTLAKFSSAVYKDSGATGMAGTADLSDTLGFAIGTSLPASGILYTSSVKILNKTLLTAEGKAAALADEKTKDFVVGDYLVTYPEKNDEFVAFAEALNKLFTEGANAGICFDSNMSGIRTRFVGGKILFGSIIPLGQLEESDYQGMRKESGFGIVPIPVYRAGDEYQTFVHNDARIVAVASLTKSFEQCAAFLDYVSTHSSAILENYYEQELAQSVQGAVGSDNVAMLTYIRNHVRDVFDKTFEDIMGDFNSATDGSAVGNRWHEILVGNGYKIANMQTVYDEMTVKKTNYLKNVITSWKMLGSTAQQ
ncbi:MAG: hypothetical protein J6Q85_07205 [Clostridia bacterium]|nr:hypothetical protein [Clostridia bacterium]